MITLSDNPNNARVVLYGGAEGGSLAFYDESHRLTWSATSDPPQDINDDPASDAGLNRGPEESAITGHRPPSDDAARPIIRSKCSAEWVDDFEMQKYCQDKQFEALANLRAAAGDSAAGGVPDTRLRRSAQLLTESDDSA